MSLLEGVTVISGSVAAAPLIFETLAIFNELITIAPVG